MRRKINKIKGFGKRSIKHEGIKTQLKYKEPGNQKKQVPKEEREQKRGADETTKRSKSLSNIKGKIVPVPD
jgi:hypothetical protein